MPTSSMGQTPLQMPELLANVLQHVDHKTLFAAAQVNSLWANEATNTLWRKSYRREIESLSAPLQGLAKCSQEQRDWYTRKIRHLDIENDYDSDVSYSIIDLLREKKFTFPNVRSVIVDLGSGNMKETDMAQFLSPSVVSLELFGGYYTRWFLKQVQMHAPILRYFLLDNRLVDEEGMTESLTAKDFMVFLENMPSISHLELHLGWQPIIDEAVLSNIMLRPNLEKLGLGHSIQLRWEVLARIIDESPQDILFPMLRYLEIAAEKKALQLLLPNLPHLQGVRLVQIDIPLHPGNHILGSLSYCPRLEDIIFDSEHPTLISPKDLLKLASGCPELRRLELGDNFQCDVGFTDELLETLVSKWKHLAVLSLPFTVELSIVSLISLARHCPCLYELKLMTDLELTLLADESEKITFPSLDFMQVGQITSSRLETEQDVDLLRSQLIQLLDNRFPALNSFSFNLTVDSDRSSGLAKAIKRHLGNTRTSNFDSRPLPVDLMLTRRLVEPIPGSRYNPSLKAGWI